MDLPPHPITCQPPADDFDLDAHVAWTVQEIEAGRQQVPAESQLQGPAVSISLGDAADLDPELLVVLCGPDGLAGPRNQALNEAFAQHRPADATPPGPVLAALTEQAFGELATLTDNQLTGALHAATRLANRAFYLQTLAVAEFTRRRTAQLEAAKAARLPHGCRPGEYPDLELAAELLISRRRAATLMDHAADLTTRLPRTLAGMANGTIDPTRAQAIADATMCLTDPDAAKADDILAADAPDIRADTLARRAASLAMKLDPEAVRREKEDAKATRQRVEFRPETTGNAAICLREIDTAEAMATQSGVNAIAVRLRNAGLAGSLDSLRTRAALDLLQFRNPLDRVAPVPPGPAEQDETAAFQPVSPAADEEDEGSVRNPAASDGNAEEDDEGGVRYPSGPGTPAGGPAPLPALVNLIVPAGTLLGWDTTPGQAAGWGLTDPEETRDIVQAASNHPRTRWCVTVVNAAGEAIAHACARGRHPWTPGDQHPPPQPPADQHHPPGTGRQSDQTQALLRALGITPGSLAPIAKGTCDHRHAEDRYTPSRKLKHIIRARSQTCTAPGCAAQAFHADQDHVIPYPDGATDECNLHAPCRAHHRAKQAPGWYVDQPEPGILRWRLPNGRTHVTRPTVYAS